MRIVYGNIFLNLILYVFYYFLVVMLKLFLHFEFQGCYSYLRNCYGVLIYVLVM